MFAQDVVVHQVEYILEHLDCCFFFLFPLLQTLLQELWSAVSVLSWGDENRSSRVQLLGWRLELLVGASSNLMEIFHCPMENFQRPEKRAPKNAKKLSART